MRGNRFERLPFGSRAILIDEDNRKFIRHSSGVRMSVPQQVLVSEEFDMTTGFDIDLLEGGPVKGGINSLDEASDIAFEANGINVQDREVVVTYNLPVISFGLAPTDSGDDQLFISEVICGVAVSVRLQILGSSPAGSTLVDRPIVILSINQTGGKPLAIEQLQTFNYSDLIGALRKWADGSCQQPTQWAVLRVVVCDPHRSPNTNVVGRPVGNATRQQLKEEQELQLVLEGSLPNRVETGFAIPAIGDQQQQMSTLNSIN